MELTQWLMLWKDVGLFLYAILKAFLPLPSLEVLLVPLVLQEPSRWILYSLEGAAGTFLGGAIGYGIAAHLGRKAFANIASPEEIEKGEALMERYGIWAVFIGGITPIPDFLLAYLAGFTHMRFSLFASCDAIARLIRSLLVCACLRSLGKVINIDRFGTIFSIVLLLVLLIKWGKEKWQVHQSLSRK